MLTVAFMSDSQATVLVVDDSALVLDVVREALEARGYRVATTNDPLECERMFTEVEPDVLVVDIEMPVLDGASLIRLIQRKRLHRCVALLFSDRSHAELTATIRACEADGGAKKTPDCGDLISLIDSKLAKRRRS
jgi:CheY-like chemotaxis protein